MPIAHACPGCREQVSFDDALAGRHCPCPKCGCVIQVAAGNSTAISAKPMAPQPPQAIQSAAAPTKEPETKKLTSLAQVGGVIGATVGLAIGQYAGLMLAIPLLIAALAGWLLSRTVPERHKPLILASAVQIGQGCWMLVAKAGRDYDAAVLLTVGAALLALWPSLMVAGGLFCYQATWLLVNTAALGSNSDINKALAVHIALRLTAIAAMVYGMAKVHGWAWLDPSFARDDDIPMAEPIAAGAALTPWAQPIEDDSLGADDMRMLERGLLAIEIGLLISILTCVPLCFLSHPRLASSEAAFLQTSVNLINVISAVVIAVGMCFCCEAPTARRAAMPGVVLQCSYVCASLLLAVMVWGTDRTVHHPPKPMATGLVVSAVVYVLTGLISAGYFVSFLRWLAYLRQDQRLAAAIVSFATTCTVMLVVFTFGGVVIGMTFQQNRDTFATVVLILYIGSLLVMACCLAWLVGLVHSVRIVVAPAKAEP